MDTDSIKFMVDGKEVTVSGYPELDGRKGVSEGEGMAFFFGQGWHNHEVYVANTVTGKIRKLSTAGGKLLVDDNEIDYEAIAAKCRNGIGNAREKSVKYAGVNRWRGFEDGLCVITWMLYPDGQYFADSDGYGMKNNAEETVYAIIDTDLNIIAPFRPVNPDNISAYLKEIRENNHR